MKLTLKVKFLVPVLTVAIIGMVVTTLVSYNSSKDALQDNIKSEMTQVSNSLSRVIHDWVVDHERDIHMLAIETEMVHAAFDPDVQGHASEILHEAYRSYGSYELLAILNLQGKIVASSDPEHLGMDLSQRQYVRDALAGKASISEVLLSKASGEPIFVISEPLRNQGQVVGVIAGVVDMGVFGQEFISSVKIGTHGYAYLVDDKGQFIVHPDTGKVLKAGINGYDWGQKMLREKSGFQEYLWNGADKIVSYQAIERTGWIIAVGAELDDLFAPIVKVRNVSIYLTLLVALLIGTVIFLAVNNIVKAIRTGVDFAEKIRRGDVSTRLRIQRDDELGTLTSALDEMADSLEEKAMLAERVAAGDISGEVRLASPQDRLGLALQKMTDDLNNILDQIRCACDQITTGSSEVSDSSQALSQGATESASSLEEIAASMNELASQTKLNADNASQASQLAEQSHSAADRGNQQMQQMVTAMGEINAAGQNISKIIKVIDEIAFQTNLLALNAAVEAARAGQHGKGFAVVAEEVRNLAARSAKAASETAVLIEGSVQKAENGASIADRTAEGLNEIVEGITKVTDLVSDIAAASNEQAQGISQVNVGLSQIDQVTQQNTASAEEGAAASEELNGQAMQLRDLVSHFKLRNQSPVKRSTSPAMAAAPTAPPAAGQSSGWGDAAAKSSAIQIALDDDEFGKY